MDRARELGYCLTRATVDAENALRVKLAELRAVARSLPASTREEYECACAVLGVNPWSDDQIRHDGYMINHLDTSANPAIDAHCIIARRRSEVLIAETLSTHARSGANTQIEEWDAAAERTGKPTVRVAPIRGGARPGSGPKPKQGTAMPTVSLRVPEDVRQAVREDPDGARAALTRWAKGAPE